MALDSAGVTATPHSDFLTSDAPLAAAFARSFDALRAAPWAKEVPLEAFTAFLHGDPARVHRGRPEHFTASAVVLSPDLRRTLLCFHGKGNMWVQLGGHLEPSDTTPAEGALREAEEESGLGDLRLAHPVPIDLNRHGLAAAFGSCRAHWDVVFALIADPAPPVVSPESADVRWFDVDELPHGCAPGFEDQFGQVLRRVRSVQ